MLIALVILQNEALALDSDRNVLLYLPPCGANGSKDTWASCFPASDTQTTSVTWHGRCLSIPTSMESLIQPNPQPVPPGFYPCFSLTHAGFLPLGFPQPPSLLRGRPIPGPRPTSLSQEGWWLMVSTVNIYGACWVASTVTILPFLYCYIILYIFYWYIALYFILLHYHIIFLDLLHFTNEETGSEK